MGRLSDGGVHLISFIEKFGELTGQAMDQDDQPPILISPSSTA
jgi:hypothetical protein